MLSGASFVFAIAAFAATFASVIALSLMTGLLAVDPAPPKSPASWTSPVELAVASGAPPIELTAVST